MKIDFSPILQRDLTGIGSAIQGVAGLAQTVGGWIQSHRATKQLEKLKSPTYTQNKGIMDYYKTALQRYNVNPYQSAQYQSAQRNADRITSSGLSSLQSRRSAVGGIGKLAGIQNDALLKAGIGAENQQDQRFGQLRGATEMQAGEDRMAFQQNQVNPYEQKYNLLSMKAGGGNQIMNAGLSNIFGAGSSLSQMGMLDSIYGDGKSKKTKDINEGYRGGISFQDVFRNTNSKKLKLGGQ